MVCGLATPTEGEIELFGERAGAGSHAGPGRRSGGEGAPRIGALIEAPGIVGNLTAYENLMAKALAMGVVDAPIGRHPVDRKKMAIVPGGKQARTHWRVLEQMQGVSLLECVLENGRTHQIRVHMASLGHPVLGDPVYGRKTRWNIQGGQLLHAYRLGFTHPTTGERMIFEAPAEARFYEWYHKLGGTLEALPGEADGRTKE